MPELAPQTPAKTSAQPEIPAVLWRQRLYLRIFVAMLGSLLIAALLFAVAVRISADSESVKESLTVLNEFVAEALPATGKSLDEQRAILQNWQRKLKIDISLYNPQGQLIISVGETVLPLTTGVLNGNSVHFERSSLTLKLADGRWLVAKNNRYPNSSHFPLVWTLLLITLAIALVTYPVVRRLTRRLEQLQQTVDSFGNGQLGSRIQMDGKDEIARLGASFNRAAQQIEDLVAAQKKLLANASHELRSPLARIRMAVELLDTQGDQAIEAELKQNIQELDQLIDEILLSSRLDSANGALPEHSETDFTGLLAEECARLNTSLNVRLDAPALMLKCNAKLMRRLVRNLLENASRHGHGSPVEMTLRQTGNTLQLAVCDRGPGIPEAQREAIFDAFYRLPGASESAGGVGLGLSLVRQIAQQHGGSVCCLAREGGGSCFRVVLPQR